MHGGEDEQVSDLEMALTATLQETKAFTKNAALTPLR
jgi:hypothetical protein